MRVTTVSKPRLTGRLSTRSTIVTRVNTGLELTTAIPVVAHTAQMCVALESVILSVEQKWHSPVNSKTVTRNTSPTRMILGITWLLRRSLSKIGWPVKLCDGPNTNRLLTGCLGDRCVDAG